MFGDGSGERLRLLERATGWNDAVDEAEAMTGFGKATIARMRTEHRAMRSS